MADAAENPVYTAALAYQTTAALIAGVKLDLFTIIGSGSRTTQELSSRTGASPRGLRILCDYLAVIGLLAKEGSGYSLTPTSQRYLDNASPAAMGASIDFLAAPEMLALALDDPVAYVRQGGSPGLRHLASDHPVWVRFATAMVPYTAVTAKRVAAHVAELPGRITRVLDVAAGHGLYGIEVARVLQGATIAALDWAEVLTIAEAQARAAGVTGRYRTAAGNAFELEWGENFDLILLPNFLHHFGREECLSLLRKARNALSPSGRVLVVEFVPNEDRVSPPLQARFAFWMLSSTPNGDAYTVGDLREMALDAGFSRATARRLTPTPQTLVMLEQ